MMEINRVLQILIGTENDGKVEDFLRFLSEKLWGLYNDYIMDKIKMAESEIKWNLNLPNAKENHEYTQTVHMPEVHSVVLPNLEICLKEVTGLDVEKHGLLATVAPDGKSFAITGTPSLDAFRKDGARAESTFELVLKYTFKGIEIPEGNLLIEKRVPFIINQDPRKLWKDLPVEWEKMPEPKYINEPTQQTYVKVEALADGTPQKDIVAASKRGRSHAQEAKPRDDYFRVEHMDNGWYVMAVADGAGSAKFSRKGSQIACDESVENCLMKLGQCKAFEEAIAQYNGQEADAEKEARKVVGNFIYDIVGTAAFKAHKAIGDEAMRSKQPTKFYATTLLLTICKKFPYGWFVASFWVGDGAICLYNREEHTAKILGIPDGGEYAGMTRFLTMPEIFKDASDLYQRLRFTIVDNFTALFLMSDGVSDPKFETDANLNDPTRWDALWDDLKENGVELTDDNEEAQHQLLNWLDFWATGNHDDRTIAILYEGETPVNHASAGGEDTPTCDGTEATDASTIRGGSEPEDMTTAKNPTTTPESMEAPEQGNNEPKE